MKAFLSSVLAGLFMLLSPVIDAQVFITNDMLPLEITESGLYVVAEPLNFTSAGDAILVTANQVTLDLNGFTLTGIREGAAITQSLGHQGLVVRNGYLDSWGINAAFGTAIMAEGANNEFSDLHIRSSRGGIFAGANSLVSDCYITGITNNTSSYGLNMEGNSRVLGTLVDRVVAPTSYGIVGAGNVLVERSIVHNIGIGGTTAQAYGIALNSGRVKDSIVSQVFGGDSAYGVFSLSDLKLSSSSITQISSADEGYGARAFAALEIVHSVIGSISAGPDGDSVNIANGARVSESVVRQSDNIGLRVGSRSRVEHSVLGRFTGDEPAILLTGHDSRIEGNLITESHAAVFALPSGTNNIVIRNASFDNTFSFSTPANHIANTLVSPGIDFNHATQQYYYENIRW